MQLGRPLRRHMAGGAHRTAAPLTSPAPGTTVGRFESAVPLADWARRTLWLEIAVAVAGVVANLRDTSAWHRLLGEPPGPATPSALSDLVFGAEGLVLLLVAVLFLAWFRRVYRNLEALGARGLRFKTGWAFWGWFVPLLGLLRPKQLLDDVWRASDPDLPPTTPARGGDDRCRACSPGGGWRSSPR